MALSDLGNDAVALGVKPPAAPAPFDLGGVLKNASEVQSNLAYAQNAQTEAARHQYDLFSDQLGRAAQDLMGQPDGQDKTDRWNSYVDDFYNKGYINKFDRARFYNNPSDTVLHQALAHTMDPAKYREVTGQAAAATSAAQAQNEFRTYDPAHTAGYFPPPGSGPGAGGDFTPKAAQAPTKVQPTPGAGAGGATTDEGGNTLFKDNPYYKEAPVVPVGQKTATGPGVINPGVSPAAEEAQGQGIKQYNEEISPTINAAAHTKAELGSMQSELQSGKVSTSRLAELKQTVAGYVYGVLQGTEGPDKAAVDASKMVGLDLPWSEAFQKDSTRMGLLFSKDSIGAREALQSIRIALGANPSLMNTTQGNLKVIDIMNRGADYDIERGKAATAYMAKQQDATGTPHLTGFDNYFVNAHPPAQFVSKAVPYQVPRLRDGGINDTELKPGVTYDLPGGKQGVWDDKRRGFVPVRQ